MKVKYLVLLASAISWGFFANPLMFEPKLSIVKNQAVYRYSQNHDTYEIEQAVLEMQETSKIFLEEELDCQSSQVIEATIIGEEPEQEMIEVEFIVITRCATI
ncbi:hypothetical protein H1P_2800011 [Hyella patelloides LEGE 07179]|uniref:Uncharacterized protein n=1 Tax=Hyella patelloides LEGE 07179 TaxID=945734 RepID=A0A563VTD7_9CYAN|nr:hypothetical protein [Hyella patelloides]VEP14707.1 hypothetical protein H1P_2800011 [Hyella patelloides LEGE 07179]